MICVLWHWPLQFPWDPTAERERSDIIRVGEAHLVEIYQLDYEFRLSIFHPIQSYTPHHLTFCTSEASNDDFDRTNEESGAHSFSINHPNRRESFHVIIVKNPKAFLDDGRHVAPFDDDELKCFGNRQLVALFKCSIPPRDWFFF